jgi:DNA helicase-2/ATP-dependent DNA helicase PcrA
VSGELNADQQAIIDDREGARCVVAGPGTGKTTTMVELIQEMIDCRIPASAIRAVTFSKEMADTLEKRLRIKGIASTFHSLGYLICNDVEHKPVEPERRHRLMIKLIRRWGMEYKELDTFISKMRREDISPEVCAECGEYDYGFASAYAEYERVRAAEGWMDFDSMLHDSVQYLENAQFRARWQYRYLIVDEAQDTDNLQWKMMQQMSEKYGNITVVGDPNQAIYGFRGAKPENITNFQQWFPGGRNFYLGINYRSTRNIVDFVRENAPKDTPKELLEKMVAARTEAGKKIGMKMYWTDDAEAESALKLASADPLNSVILARTNRMVGLLERTCNRHGVRYHLLGKTGYWKQNEIRKAVESLKDYPNLSAVAACNLALPHLESKYEVADRTERDNDALDNLKTLRIIATEHNTAKDFVTYANKMMHRRNDARGITISTIHQAKGGEWDNVYIIGANAKMIPHKSGDPLEEARIYFVAISRPKNYLRISFAGTPSPYLRKYLTDEILERLTASAEEVEKLQQQHKMFEERS